MTSTLMHLECSGCHRLYDADQLMNVCECGSTLLPRYDLIRVRQSLSRDELSKRSPDMWRYRELLPVRDSKWIVSMGEGFTPLYSLARLGREIGLNDVLIKDEGMNPGGTFKARGASAALSRALELGAKTVAIATNGNAGAAWALYGARAGVETVVIMPVDAQNMPQRISLLAGARTYLVPGLISDAGRIVQRGARRRGWFDVCTLKEPYRIEGKKTVGYELAEQLGWTLPDVIVCPAGGGILIAALYKAFREMQELGWIGDRLPRLVGVQAAGCRPLVDAFAAGEDESRFYEGAQTYANGLRVPKSAGDRLVLQAIRATGGRAISVTDEETQAALQLTGRLEGVFLCPEAAAAVAGLQQLVAAGALSAGERTVVMGTGSGLQYPETVPGTPEVIGLEADL